MDERHLKEALPQGRASAPRWVYTSLYPAKITRAVKTAVFVSNPGLIAGN
jgi:hypothetical protein